MNRQAGRRRLIPELCWLFATLALALPAMPGRALDSDVLPTQYRIDSWRPTTGSYLQSTIQAIVQTPDGLLWIGTETGLLSFDGQEFTPLENNTPKVIAKEMIGSLLVTRDGVLLVGTSSGLWQYKDGTFALASGCSSLKATPVSALYEAGDATIWIGTERSGLFRLKDRHLEPAPILKSTSFDVIAIACDNAGTLWVSTADNGLFRRDSSGFSSFRPDLFEKIYIYDLVSRGNDIWIGTEKGLFRVAEGSLDYFTQHDGLSNEQSSSLLVDREGNVWVGSWLSGLVRGKIGHAIPIWKTAEQLDGPVSALFEDREGSIWVGVFGGGLSRLRDTPVHVFGEAEGLSSNLVYSICKDSADRIWIGTQNGGINLITGSTIRILNFENRSPARAINSFFEDREGTIWLGTTLGVCIIRSGSIAPPPWGRPAPDALTTCMVETSDDILLFGTPNGLYRWDPRKPAAPPQYDNNIGEFNITALFIDHRGRLWISTRGAGLFRLDRQSIDAFLPTAIALPSENIRDVAEDEEGRVWVATSDAGLFQVSGNQALSIPLPGGIVASTIYRVIPDQRGSIWLTTRYNIFRLAIRDLLDRKEGRQAPLSVLKFGVDEGLPSARILSGFNSALLTRDGRLWVLTDAGVVVVDITKAPGALEPGLTIMIDRLVADGVSYEPTRNIELPSGTRSLAFHFRGQTLVAPWQLFYRYRLDGRDGDWTETTGGSTASYAGIPPGHYSFRASARRPNGEWGAENTPIALHIRPYFYQTAYFYILCGVMGAGMIGLTFHLRSQKDRHRFQAVVEERQRIAREIHDSLAQGLTGISIHLEGLEETLVENPEAAVVHLHWARQLVQESIKEAHRTVWNLRAGISEDLDLAQVIRKIGAGLTAGIDAQLTIYQKGPKAALSPTTEEALVRIAQEALTNAVRHSKSTAISIEIEYLTTEVRLEIKDNGAGFDPSAIGSGHSKRFGLVGMRERAEAIGGRIDVISVSGQGTTVTVVAPNH